MTLAPRLVSHGSFPGMAAIRMDGRAEGRRLSLLPSVSTTIVSCHSRSNTGAYRHAACLTFSRMASTQRSLHSSSKKPAPSAGLTIDAVPSSLEDHHRNTGDTHSNTMAKSAVAPLSVLPLTNILRSLMTTTVSSSSILLPPSLAVMSLLAHTTNPLLNPDRNPLLRYVLKKTFYAQFCAGENAQEVMHTVESLKSIGFSGVILGYAKEVVMTKDQTANLETSSAEDIKANEEIIARDEVTPWANGTLETVMLATEGDFVALKFTGAGQHALVALMRQLPPCEALGDAIDRICQLASERGVRLLFDAEQQAVQAGIDDWTLQYMRKYNRPSPGENTVQKAVIYGTYQAYLKATPRILSEHLSTAQKEGFTLGVKLVRGAYLGSDPRHVIYDTKADTDAAYDGIAKGLVSERWNSPLKTPAPGKEEFPQVDVVLASHNRDSVLDARRILQEQQLIGKAPNVAFAQLQGMADEVSCELVTGENAVEVEKAVAKPQVYKYLVWGSTGECMKYLFRRAQENRDAVQRTRSGRDAMRSELVRRVKRFFGLSG